MCVYIYNIGLDCPHPPYPPLPKKPCCYPTPHTISWPLHDIVITNFVWCIAYKRETEKGIVYCVIIVQ